MIDLDTVKLKAARKNSDSNNRLHFFASKFSIYFSWLFINLGLNANQVTGVFFLTGLAGSLTFLIPGSGWVVLAYTLWRLHIIFDLCDGDVARYNQQFSINGAYWDYMIHSILYPLSFVCICISLAQKYDANIFMYMAIFGGIVVSQLTAVKNNYYRAMLFNSIKLDNSKSAKKSHQKSISIREIAQHVLSYEGFLAGHLLLSLVGVDSMQYLIFIAFYTGVFALVCMAKFFLFSKQGFYERRT